MIDFNTISAVVLDVAKRKSSGKQRQNMAEIIWNLLEKGYQIFLVSSKKNDDFSEEDFKHSNLFKLSGASPPDDQTLKQYPQLLNDTTLWVTEQRILQQWLVEKGLPIAHQSGRKSLGAKIVRLGSISDLIVLLSPTARVLNEIGKTIIKQREGRERKSALIGIGGPPSSKFKEFTLELKNELQSQGCPLVELMDFTSLLNSTDNCTKPSDVTGPWQIPAAGDWVVKHILQPFKSGDQVFIETLPDEVTQDFEPHLPLFLSEESIVLLMGEMLFFESIRSSLDLSILLEVSQRETTRRLYEIPKDQPFDDKFTKQYQEHEGAVYRQYLIDQQVESQTTIRINAEHSKAFTLNHIAEF